MTVDSQLLPEIKEFLEERLTRRDRLGTLSVAELRALAAEEVRASSSRVISGVQREDFVISLEGRDLPARLYFPDDPREAVLSTLVWFHGGGFVLGGVDTVDDLCAELSRKAECRVLSVGYRRAPEHHWPAAHHDALEALEWVRANLAAGTALAVGGDSAGGHLAAWVSAMNSATGRPPLAGQVLLYPVITDRDNTSSYRDFASGFGLTRDDMQSFFATYQPSAGTSSHPFDLMRADPAGVCPTFVVTAECDVLRDEAEQFARKLAEGGVDVTSVRYNGMPHGFCQMTAVTPTAARALASAASFVAEILRPA